MAVSTRKLPKPAAGVLPVPLERYRCTTDSPHVDRQGSARPKEHSSLVEACRAGHDTGFEPVEESWHGSGG
jgi:hypothetical protein